MLEIIISIICAVISLIATIIIANVQYKQGKRMEEMTKVQFEQSKRMEELSFRQDEDEKRNRSQRIVAERNSFIMKYHGDTDEINLLPLCWISSIYNPTFHYHRKMYMEFNMLEEDIQDAICEYMNFKVQKPNVLRKEFYNECVKALQKESKQYLTQAYADPIFYDNAKYLLYCIAHHKGKELPIQLHKLEDKLTDYLKDYKFERDKCKYPIDEYVNQFGFCGADEQSACEICAVAAKWVAEWSKADSDRYWIPGEYGYETLDTFEDLFLCALFCIYIYLINPISKEEINE